MLKAKEVIIDGAMKNIHNSVEVAWLNGYRHGVLDNPNAKRGEWIKDDAIRKGEWSCSMCHEYLPWNAVSRVGKPMYQYCPYCGAAMREEQT